MKKIEKVKNILAKNSTKFFSVDFIKADGSPRTINGNLRYVKGHDGENTVKHLDKYFTIVLPEKTETGKAQFRNVNIETIKALRVGGKVYKF